MLLPVLRTNAQIKILFDATKAESAGNADWVIDAQGYNLAYNGTTGLPYISSNNTSKSNPAIIPLPAQSGITSSTAETYWTGALSYWAIDCVNKGYHVETLPPITGKITYGDNTNAQDLSKYDVYVVDEPNLKFSTSEANAIVNFVKNGGGLYMISDHTGANRTFSGYDAVTIWNDLMTNNTVQKDPFGIKIDSTNISGIYKNTINAPTDSLLHGPAGNPIEVQWSNGATMTLNTTANSTVKGIFFSKSGSTTTNVLCAYCRYGKGKVVAMSDSSPFDDGTGNPNLATGSLYTGYTVDAAGNHRLLIMNATIWLATKPHGVPLEFISFSASLNNHNNALLNWSVNQSGDDIAGFDIQFSGDGETFSSCGKESLLNEQGTVNYYFTDNKIPLYQSNGSIYYRIAAIYKDGTEKYSNIVSVHPAKKTEMILYPNPTKNKLMIHVDAFTQPVTLTIVSTEGKVMYQQTMNESNGSITIPVSNFRNGNYFLRLVKADGTTANAAFIKD